MVYGRIFCESENRPVLQGYPFGHGSRKGARPMKMRCSSFRIVASNLLTAARQRETLEIERHTLGTDSPDTVTSIYNLASIAAHRNQDDEAISLLREAIGHGLLKRGALPVDKEAGLKSLVGGPRFVALAAQAKEPGSSPEKPH